MLSWMGPEARAVRQRSTGRLGDTAGPHGGLRSPRAIPVGSCGSVDFTKLRHCDPGRVHTVLGSLCHTSPLAGGPWGGDDALGTWPRGSHAVETSVGVSQV